MKLWSKYQWRRYGKWMILCICMIVFGIDTYGCAAKSSRMQSSDMRVETFAYGFEMHPELADDDDSVDPDAWELILVNPWNPIPESYSVSLVRLRNGQAVDERCYPDLQEMMDDCRLEGLSPLICSSYRTWEKQEQLYWDEVRSLKRQGYSEDEAQKKAATSNAVPGTSEHQLGLAVDIVDIGNQKLDETQEGTAVSKWLRENSWKYGFILRYPNGKSEITGIIYEPWHYRYVGREAAREIYERGICLEEYLTT